MLRSLFASVRASFCAVVSVSTVTVRHSEHVVMSILALVHNYIPSHQHVSMFLLFSSLSCLPTISIKRCKVNGVYYAGFFRLETPRGKRWGCPRRHGVIDTLYVCQTCVREKCRSMLCSTSTVLPQWCLFDLSVPSSVGHQLSGICEQRAKTARGLLV